MLKDYSTKSITLCVCKSKIDSFSVSRALCVIVYQGTEIDENQSDLRISNRTKLSGY